MFMQQFKIYKRIDCVQSIGIFWYITCNGPVFWDKLLIFDYAFLMTCFM